MKVKINVYVLRFVFFGICLILFFGCKKDDDTSIPAGPVPELTTTAVTDITQLGAKCGGNITSAGGINITERGVCWSKGPTPTIADSRTNDGDGAGTFTSEMNGLIPSTTYYVRSYATNTNGTGYGAAIMFQTLSLDVTMVSIPAGGFVMGSPLSEVGRNTNEIKHSVTLSAFRMSKFEITNTEFASFLNTQNIGADGRYASGIYPTQTLIYVSSFYTVGGVDYTLGYWAPVKGYENHPVINVTWYGAAEFANFVGGRLPTEAEWEFACRAKTSTPFNTGGCLSDMQANYFWRSPYNLCTNTSSTTLSKTQDVGSYSPNAFGLYDMHGNVREWCSDWYADYLPSHQTDPIGPDDGTYRLCRGGGCLSEGNDCRAAIRTTDKPNYYGGEVGFRVVKPE